MALHPTNTCRRTFVATGKIGSPPSASTQSCRASPMLISHPPGVPTHCLVRHLSTLCAALHSVWVPPGSCNETAQAGSLDNTSLSLKLPEAGGPRSKHQQRRFLVRTPFLACRGPPPPRILMWRTDYDLSLPLLIKPLIPSQGSHPRDCAHLPKAPPPNAIALGVRMSSYALWGAQFNPE